MGENIYLILQVFTSGIFFISLFFSIIIIKRPKPSYMKLFFLYPLVGCLIVILFWIKYFNYLPLRSFIYINTVSLIFHFCFFGIFIYNAVLKKRILKYTLVVFLLIIFIFIYRDIINKSAIAFAVTNTFLWFLSIYYFYNLFLDPPIINLSKEPSFWVCCGILLGCGIIIPFKIFNPYFIIKLNKDALFLLGSISTLGYGIIHLFLIKANLCILRLQK